MLLDGRASPTRSARPADGEAVAVVGLDDVVHHYARIVRSFDTEPVMVGHSIGGLIVQRLIGMNLGRSAVAIAAAPIKGVQLGSAFAHLCAKLPAFSDPDICARLPELSAEQFRYVIANAVTEVESACLFERYAIPSPGRTLFDAAYANSARNCRTSVRTDNATRGPLLLISGQEDCLVPDAITRAVYKLYGDSRAVTELKQFVDRGHSMIIDGGWRAVADYTLTWLAHVGVSPSEQGC
ncbi:alpha/beta fold hydrolase [Streptomyces chiangmaiensis]